ncbi:putative bifunctional diguanylate cyclase/phosphodiesterase [Aerosakkonema sp. BLCC-F183]|uniref:putative bifunctional diguanylate cyclase/phosphodiesterase n=1 Tax=Aerosakkonema sp. BLCC-F183 TaxID=3342834 RepID=UPI0035BAA149
MKIKPEKSIDYRQQICDCLRNVNTKAQAKLLTLKHLKNKLENPVQEGTDELRIAFQELQNKIAELKRAEEELKESLSLQRAALESTVDGILVVNKNRKIATYNQKFVQMWRIPADIIALKDDKEALSFVVYQLKNPESFLAKVGEMYAQPEAESCDVLEFKDGRIFERYSQPQRLGKEIVGRVWSFRDITERRMAEETIRYQALHDLLTDLPNRILFNERLSGALVNAKSNQGTIAVMFLDLDRFKTINDTLSHACGDQLLQMVAERLTSSLWQHDTVARWGGDEFTLLLPQISCAEDAARIAQVILDTLKQPFNIEGHQLHISSSIGISLYPHDGEDGETLLRNADAALHRAKEQGRNNYQFYTAAMNSHASELLMLENELHQALERGEFVVYYQPQINTNTGKIAQMEALLRWQHPEFGLVSPAKFIPLAEENGLIIPIGEWVLRTACTQIKAWQDAGLPPLCVAVNLSARQFQQPNLVEMVARALQETGLENHFLELEITESVAMQNVDFSRSILQELHNMGVSISMDDFGTGYSSLSYLKKFPLDKLKIDQSFVRELATDPNDGAIIAAIAALGKVLNLTMVAEGVETEEQRDFLRSLECEYMQGYLFSKPLSPQDATELLENYRSSPNPVITITPSSYCSLCFNKRFNKGFVQ